MLAFLEKQKTRGRELLLGTSWWVRLKADEPIAPAAGFFFSSSFPFLLPSGGPPPISSSHPGGKGYPKRTPQIRYGQERKSRAGMEATWKGFPTSMAPFHHGVCKEQAGFHFSGWSEEEIRASLQFGDLAPHVGDGVAGFQTLSVLQTYAGEEPPTHISSNPPHHPRSCCLIGSEEANFPAL